MWITVGPAWASVTRATPAEEAWLASFLSIEDKQAQQFEAHRLREWRARAAEARAAGLEPPPRPVPLGDGKLRLLHRGQFPSGLLDSVMRAAALAGHHADVLDQRAPAPRREVDLSWMRDYQREALEACLAKARGVVKAPTGSGKTAIISALVQSVDCRWLIAAPQIDLLDQIAAEVLKFTGERCGKVGDGAWAPKRVTVATLQTLAERARDSACRALVQGAGGLVVDECHVAAAPSFYKVLMSCPAPRRIGFSGTPFARGDGRSIYVMAALGPKAFEVRAPELVDRGVLSRPTIRMFPLRQHAPARMSWREVYRQLVVESEARNAAVVALAREAPKPCLVFVKEIDHGKLLLRALRRHLPTGFVWGDTDSEGRQAAIKALVRDDYQVLVSSTIFEQGVDIRELRSIVVASGGKSAIRAVQRLGRAMRVVEGKQTCELWDFDDMGQVWLDRHSQARIAAYLKEGHSVIKLERADAHLLLKKWGA